MRRGHVDSGAAMMAVDTRLVGYLNRALGHEMAAVQQYLAQSRLCDLWGHGKLCAHFRQDAVEELRHAEDLMGALLEQGVAPQAAQVQPVRLGRSLDEMLRIDHALEIDAVRLYETALEYCRRLGADRHGDLFSRILDDELKHLDELARLGASSIVTKESQHE